MVYIDRCWLMVHPWSSKFTDQRGVQLLYNWGDLCHVMHAQAYDHDQVPRYHSEEATSSFSWLPSHIFLPIPIVEDHQGTEIGNWCTELS